MTTFVGSAGNDIFTGGSDDDSIAGGAGNDSLVGAGGNDSIIGGSGNDTIDGGEGNDILFSDESALSTLYQFNSDPDFIPVMDDNLDHDIIRGGAGSDIIYAGYGDDVAGGDQDGYYGDRLYISFRNAPSGINFDAALASQTIGGGTITGIESVELVVGSRYDDIINLKIQNVSYGSGNPEAFGLDGNDKIIAGYYTSLMNGGDGDDTLDGTSSSYLRIVDGGSGADTILFSNVTSNTVYGGAGNDTIKGGGGNIYGGSGDDQIELINTYYYPANVFGDDGNDSINGSAAQNGLFLFGGAGADTLTGGDGADYVGSFNREASPTGY